MACVEVSLSKVRFEDPVWRALAEEELGETDDVIRNGIRELREVVRADTRVKCCLDDEVLLLFLRSRKFDVSGTFEKIKNCCKVMCALGHLRDKMRVSRVGHVYRLPFLSLGQELDEKGRTIVSFLLGQWNPSECSFDDVASAALLFLQGQLASDARTQVGGFVFVIDMGGFGFSHITHIPPSFLKLLPFLLKDGNPMRIKQIHVVNESRFSNFVYTAIRPLLNKKITDRIMFHGAKYKKTLHEQVHPKYLPPALGGTCLTFKDAPHTETMERLEKEGYLKGLLALDYVAA